MKSRHSITEVIINGILVVIPVIALIYIGKELFNFIEDLIEPITSILPDSSLFGIGVKRVAVLAVIALITFITGIFVTRTGSGIRIIEKLEMVIPGFMLFKNVLLDKFGEGNEKIKTCLANIDETWLFAFIVEDEHDAEFITVFVPDTPSFGSGSVHLMKEDQIMRLSSDKKSVARTIIQYGIGANSIIKGHQLKSGTHNSKDTL